MGDVGSHSEEEFRECFSLFDTEKKNAIAEFEFACCLRSMALNPTEREVKALFNEVAEAGWADVEGTLAAGRKFARHMASANPEQQFRRALKVLDDGTGAVPSAEIRKIVANLKVKTETIGGELVQTPIGHEELDEAMDEIAPYGATQISIDALATEVFQTVSIPPLSELVLEPKQRRLPPGGESMYTRW